MKIAVDAMGTDKYPVADVAGAILAARDFNVKIILVGNRTAIETEIQKHDISDLEINIVHADEVISMEDKPNIIVRGKAKSSMHIGMSLVKSGEADAFVTAGNTGAALAVSMFQLKRIPGVRRPAITAVGELANNLITIVDVGANTDTKLDWLQQFAIMGNIYAESVLKIKKPRVGLLANGEEEGKGDQLVRDAHKAFKEMSLNFVGNIEPKDLFNGKVDVIVTDGYVGNILLKTYEATVDIVFNLIRKELMGDMRAKIGATLARPALRRVVKFVDPTQYGGAPLLGVNGVVIITHGGATPQVICNSIEQAIRAVEVNLIDNIQTGLGVIGDEIEI